MTTPHFSVTGDDARYYVWPPLPGTHFPSITTIIKEGVPKPMLTAWSNKKAAQKALDNLAILIALEAAHANR